VLPLTLFYVVVIIGDSSVGKSNLLVRFTRNEFNEKSKATIGVDFGTKNVEINGKIVTAQCWDSAGQERFRAVTNGYYRGAVGAMIVYDITSKITFKNVTRWLNEVREMADQDILIILVGNKCDLEQQREVATQEATAFAEANRISFLETSALNGRSVTQAFENLLNDIYKTASTKKPLVEKQTHLPPTITTVVEDKDPPTPTPEKKGCGC